jgi:hypothetical protein
MSYFIGLFALDCNLFKDTLHFVDISHSDGDRFSNHKRQKCDRFL